MSGITLSTRRRLSILCCLTGLALPASAHPTGESLLSVRAVDFATGEEMKGAIVAVLEGAGGVPVDSISSGAPTPMKAGHYRLQAAFMTGDAQRPRRFISYPLDVDLPEGEIVSIVLPLHAVGDDLALAARVNAGEAAPVIIAEH